MSVNNKRETFSSKFGFLISCVGAALGLGNIWLFSYRLGAYRGAAFNSIFHLYFYIRNNWTYYGVFIRTTF